MKKFLTITFIVVAALILVSCSGKKSTEDAGDIIDTDTESGDQTDSSDTSDQNDTGHGGDSGADTGDSNSDTGDSTADTGDSTTDTADSGNGNDADSDSDDVEISDIDMSDNDNEESGDDADSSDSGDDNDTADSGDDNDTPDSGDDNDTADSGDDNDTADSGDDNDTADSGDDNDTADSGDDNDTTDTGDDDDTADSGDDNDADTADSGDSGENQQKCTEITLNTGLDYKKESERSHKFETTYYYKNTDSLASSLFYMRFYGGSYLYPDTYRLSGKNWKDDDGYSSSGLFVYICENQGCDSGRIYFQRKGTVKVKDVQINSGRINVLYADFLDDVELEEVTIDSNGSHPVEDGACLKINNTSVEYLKW